jgi:phosphoadenosine phosphosulfate reductase
MNAVLSNPPSELSPELQRKVSAALALLTQAAHEFGNIAYSNSLGAEAMVLTDIIWSSNLAIDIFSIDTGRLHAETHALLDRIQRRYGKRIELLHPDPARVDAYVRQHGLNGFYNGLDERLSCCQIRKVEPFRRAIAGRKAWITGVRRQQSTTRAQGAPIEWDLTYGLYKVSPLLEWTHDEVWAYIRAHQLPYNTLHDKHYPSIGCEPCTRAIQPGEDNRAGRWWWENSDSRECGLQPRVRIALQAV